ncbi:hypothetical protein AX768_01755 [Burkholderia sp. PAMC 28687]|uniref:Ig-like domain-containing protein n=1 Tax=Burkholderia sp. PAMC 28687 TaxID=1795874 RepID=UPI0007846FD6|nr:Ig-like domain-containing protein [Burkholderia sp. PAMC 28687]AMM13028.1 hypothetical protein AX768_01755 [Burkholderia sp. PAMC 28687]
MGPVTGLIPAGGVTDDPRPTINGKGQAGDLITILDNGTPIGSVTADKNGDWTFHPKADLPASNSITVTDTNPAGRTSTPSDPLAFTVDTSPVTQPTIISATDAVAPVTGLIPSGGVTDDSQPVFSGTGKAGDIVKLYDNSTTLIGTATVDTNGKWSIKPANPLSNDSHSITATETNPAGKVSEPTSAFPFTVDTSPATQPTIISATDSVAPVTGLIPSGGTTDDAQPVFSGTGKAGEIVKLYDNGTTLIGTATVDTNGKWSIKPANPLSNDSHSITATETNAAGKVSNPTSAFPFTVDTSAATIPTIISATDGVGAVTGVIPKGGVTDDAEPVFSGTGKAGDIVKLYDNGTTLIGSATVDTNGKWSIKPQNPLSNDSHSVTAKETNAAGKVSDPTSAYPFTVDTSPATKPTITSATDAVGPVKGTVPDNGVTDDAQPLFNGTGKAGDTVKLWEGTTLLGSGTVDTNGNWSIKPMSALSNATHTVTATETNPAGNTGNMSDPFHVTVLTGNPATPAAPTVTDNGVNVPNGGTMPDGHPTISGTGTKGDVIHIMDNGNEIGSVTVNPNGTWSYSPGADYLTPTVPHAITVKETNLAGNTSDASPSTTVSYVLLPTEAVVITNVIDDSSGTNVSVPSGTGYTYYTTPILKGTLSTGLTAGEHLVVYRDGVALTGSPTVNGTNWTYNDSGVTAGTHTYTAKVVNTNGSGPVSNPYTITEGVAGAVGQLVIDCSVNANGTATYRIGKLGANNTLTEPTLPGRGAGSWSLTAWNLDGTMAFRVFQDAAWSKFASTSITLNPNLLYSASLSYPKVLGSPSCSYDVRLGSDVLHAHFTPISLAAVPPNFYGSGGIDANGNLYTITAPVKATLHATVSEDALSSTAHTDTTTQSNDTTTQPHHTVVGEHDTFTGQAQNGNETVDLNMDPASYFKQASAHIEGAKGGAVDTLHLTGDHQVLDLTSLTGKTAAAKISGIEAVDLGGHANTLKLSLTDVLNLGETDLFQKDGKQQMMVNGSNGDTVDLSNAHVAGLAEGEWQQHGTTQVGGVTYNVYEHSGAHTELLVQQPVRRTYAFHYGNCVRPVRSLQRAVAACERACRRARNGSGSGTDSGSRRTASGRDYVRGWRNKWWKDQFVHAGNQRHSGCRRQRLYF